MAVAQVQTFILRSYGLSTSRIMRTSTLARQLWGLRPVRELRPTAVITNFWGRVAPRIATCKASRRTPDCVLARALQADQGSASRWGSTRGASGRSVVLLACCLPACGSLLHSLALSAHQPPMRPDRRPLAALSCGLHSGSAHTHACIPQSSTCRPKRALWGGRAVEV